MNILSISQAVFFMFSVGGKRRQRCWVDESMAKSNRNLLHCLLCTANCIVWNSARQKAAGGSHFVKPFDHQHAYIVIVEAQAFRRIWAPLRNCFTWSNIKTPYLLLVQNCMGPHKQIAGSKKCLDRYFSDYRGFDRRLHDKARFSSLASHKLELRLLSSLILTDPQCWRSGGPFYIEIT